MQNQTRTELYINDNKSKISSNPTDILKSAKRKLRKTLDQEDNFQNCHY